MTPPLCLPNPLIDEVLSLLGMTLDKQLSLTLDIHATTLSNIRHGRREVSAPVILAFHDATGLSVRRIKELDALGRQEYQGIDK